MCPLSIVVHMACVFAAIHCAYSSALVHGRISWCMPLRCCNPETVSFLPQTGQLLFQLLDRRGAGREWWSNFHIVVGFSSQPLGSLSTFGRTLFANRPRISGSLFPTRETVACCLAIFRTPLCRLLLSKGHFVRLGVCHVKNAVWFPPWDTTCVLGKLCGFHRAPHSPADLRWLAADWQADGNCAVKVGGSRDPPRYFEAVGDGRTTRPAVKM